MIYVKISNKPPHIHGNIQVCLNQLCKNNSQSFFLSRGPHIKQKKIVQKTHTVQLHCTVQPHNASRPPILHFRTNLVKVITCMCARPRPSRSTSAENITNAWLPYTNMGKHLKCDILNSKV